VFFVRVVSCCRLVWLLFVCFFDVSLGVWYGVIVLRVLLV